MGETDVESADRQIKHQMIAHNNKDFVPACRYGLRGLHGGQHVQLPINYQQWFRCAGHDTLANGVYCI